MHPKVKEIEEIIQNIRRQYSIAKVIEAVNEVEERKRFLNSKIKKNPNFKYIIPIIPSKKYINDIKENIKKIPHKLIPFYEKYPELIEKEFELMHNLGRDKVKEISKEIYGIPSHKTIKEAEKIVDVDVEELVEPKIISAETLHNIFKDMLEIYYGIEWKIELTDKYSTTVYPESQTISICRNRMFGLNEVKRLVNHEIKVHALRTINGYNQPLKVLGIGLPYYLKTEEGLAVFMEKITGVLNIYALKLRAVRVLAVKMMLEDMNFVDVFYRIKEYGYSDKTAWNITYRVFRGGGYTKDYVYLEGFLEIDKFVSKNGLKGLKPLFVGKIALQHINFIKNLINIGIIKEPRYLPEEIEEIKEIN